MDKQRGSPGRRRLAQRMEGVLLREGSGHSRRVGEWFTYGRLFTRGTGRLRRDRTAEIPRTLARGLRPQAAGLIHSQHFRGRGGITSREDAVERRRFAVAGSQGCARTDSAHMKLFRLHRQLGGGRPPARALDERALGRSGQPGRAGSGSAVDCDALPRTRHRATRNPLRNLFPHAG